MTTLLAVTGDTLTMLAEEDGRWSARPLHRADDMRVAAAHPSDERVLFAGTRGNGLHRSVDAGASWHRIDLPEADVFAVAASPADGAVYAGTEPSRLFRSRDVGETWEELEALQDIPSRDRWSFPPRPHTSHVRAIAPHPEDPDLILVGIELGGVMRTTDGGATFEDHAVGAVRDVHALAWHPRRRDRAYEAGGGGAAWTQDRGATWRGHDEGRDRDYCWGLAVDPSDPDRWLVSAAVNASRAHRAGASDAAVYLSEGAASWRRVVDGLPEPLNAFPYALAATERSWFVGLSDGRIFAADVRPGRGRTALGDAHGSGLGSLRFAPIDVDASATKTLRELIPLGTARPSDGSST